jgi:hypothetical protein
MRPCAARRCRETRDSLGHACVVARHVRLRAVYRAVCTRLGPSDASQCANADRRRVRGRAGAYRCKNRLPREPLHGDSGGQGTSGFTLFDSLPKMFPHPNML